MLPKNRRIQRSLFPYIMKESKRYYSTSFVLYVAKIKDSNRNTPSKFSFSVSKKILKLAVDRNKQRRRGYAIIKKNLSSIKDGFYCFFVYKKGFCKDYKELEEDIFRLLSSSLMIR